MRLCGSVHECWDVRKTPCRYVRPLGPCQGRAGASLAPVLGADTRWYSEVYFVIEDGN